MNGRTYLVDGDAKKRLIDLVNSPSPEPKLDRTHLVKEPIGQQGNDPNYWRGQTPEARLGELERLRRQNYAYDPDTTRLSRLHPPVKRAKG